MVQWIKIHSKVLRPLVSPQKIQNRFLGPIIKVYYSSPILFEKGKFENNIFMTRKNQTQATIFHSCGYSTNSNLKSDRDFWTNDL